MKLNVWKIKVTRHFSVFTNTIYPIYLKGSQNNTVHLRNHVVTSGSCFNVFCRGVILIHFIHILQGCHWGNSYQAITSVIRKHNRWIWENFSPLIICYFNRKFKSKRKLCAYYVLYYMPQCLWDWIIIFSRFMWFVYPHSWWLLHWHWGNHMIAPVPVKQPWKKWVKLVNT